MVRAISADLRDWGRRRSAALAQVDPGRHEIDEVVARMLRIDSPELLAELPRLRRSWCWEPSVNGLRRSIMRELGVNR